MNLPKLPQLPQTQQQDLTGTRIDSLVSPIATGMRSSLNNALGFFRDDVNKGIDSTKSRFNTTIDYLSNE